MRLRQITGRLDFAWQIAPSSNHVACAFSLKSKHKLSASLCGVCICVGSLRVPQLHPTIQRHIELISQFLKLPEEPEELMLLPHRASVGHL